MQRLGTDKIDILLIHDADRRNHGDNYPEAFRKAMEGPIPRSSGSASRAS